MADEEQFDIAFAGECLEGFDYQNVRESLRALFKASDATLDALFSGKKQRIKQRCNRETAAKFQRAMRDAGARAIVTRSPPSRAPIAAESTAARANTTAMQQQDAGSVSTASLSLAPSGSDVLTNQERERVATSDIDTSHLDVAPTGENLGPLSPPVFGEPEAPSFELLEAGTRLSEPQTPGDSTAPDASKISLSPAEHDLSDCAPPEAAAPEFKFDGMDLADAGTPMLAEEYREDIEGSAPDTSHLTLTPAEDERPD
ncbi:MAG: hypothetical protein AAF662_14900 [Pseudomonadota bacterium]